MIMACDAATPIAKPLRLTPQVCFADYRLCRTFGIKMPPRTIRSPQNNGVPAKRSFVGKRSGSPSSEAAICKYFYKANRGEPKGLANIGTPKNACIFGGKAGATE